MSSKVSFTSKRAARACALLTSLSQIAATSTPGSLRSTGRCATWAIAPAPTTATRTGALFHRRPGRPVRLLPRRVHGRPQLPGRCAGDGQSDERSEGGARGPLTGRTGRRPEHRGQPRPSPLLEFPLLPPESPPESAPLWSPPPPELPDPSPCSPEPDPLPWPL